MKAFLNNTGVAALGKLNAEIDAYAARINWIVSDYPWAAKKADGNSWEKDALKAYVIFQHRKRTLCDSATAEAFVAANYSGIAGDKHVLHKAYSAADRKSTRLNSSHIPLSRMPSSA